MKFTICDMRFTRRLHLSKHITKCGLALIALNLLLTSCEKHDSSLHHQLVGTWEKEKSFEMTLESNGTFHSQSGSSNSIKQINYFGTWAVKNGVLQMTLTNIYAQGVTNLEAVGSIDSMRIIQVNASNLGLENQSQSLFYNRK